MNKNKKLWVKLLKGTALTAVAFGLASSGYALAQEDDTDKDTIIVTGIKRSIADSITEKKNNDSIVEAISAEDIGKLPDVSIAESLARLPGLAAQRLNGRGQVITVRGLSPDFTTALLNGREQVSTSNNRGVEFDQYPSELIRQVVVYKTPDAQLFGQGLAGTADMRTVRPLDENGRTIAVNGRYTFLENGALNGGTAENGYRGSATYIDQTEDGTLGWALGLSSMSTPTQGQRFRSWGYPDASDGNPVIGGAVIDVQSVELERNSVVGVLQYEPSDNFSATLDAYYSNFHEYQLKRGLEIPLLWSSAQLQDGYTVADGLITNGTYTGVKPVLRGDVDDREADLYSVGLNVQYALSERWDLEFDFSSSSVERKDLIAETTAGSGRNGTGDTDSVTFAMNNGDPRFAFNENYSDYSKYVITSPLGWGGNDPIDGGQVGYLKDFTINDEINELTVKATHNVEGSWLESIQLGFNIKQRTKDLDVNEWILGLSNGLELAVPESLRQGVTDLSTFGLTSGLISYDPLELIYSSNINRVVNPNSDISIKSWGVEENLFTAFAMGVVNTDFADRPLRGNFGVQIVSTEQTSTGTSASGANDSLVEVPTSGSSKYTEVLPSLNLAWEVKDDQFLRFSAARTLARPRMDSMNAALSFGINSANLDSTDLRRTFFSGGGGNPRLKPWIARAFDLSYESYFADQQGYFSAAVFYKDLESYIYNQSNVADFTGFPTGGLEPASYLGVVTIPANGEGGSVYGYELSTSVPLEVFGLDGFGLLLSHAHNKSSVDPDGPDGGAEKSDLPGLSKNVSNVTFYYENYGFQGRVSARKRSDFLGEVQGFGNGLDLVKIAGETIIDAQLGYTFQGGFAEGIYVYLSGQNLTDQDFVTFYNDDRNQVQHLQRYGASYELGISYKF